MPGRDAPIQIVLYEASEKTLLGRAMNKKYETLSALRYLYAAALASEPSMKLSEFVVFESEIVKLLSVADLEELEQSLRDLSAAGMITPAEPAKSSWRVEVKGLCEGIELREIPRFLASFSGAVQESQVHISMRQESINKSDQVIIHDYVDVPLKGLSSALGRCRNAIVSDFLCAGKGESVYLDALIPRSTEVNHLPIAFRDSCLLISDSPEIYLHVSNQEEMRFLFN